VKTLASLTALFMLVLLPVVAPAQEATTAPDPGAARSRHPAATEAISNLRSPYCPGLMLEVCPSPQAESLRDSIQALAEAGVSARELVEWMVGNHGETYRAIPLTRGAGLWAWIGPPFALLMGVVGLFFLFLRVRRQMRNRPAPVPARKLSDAEREQVRVALQEMETLEEPIL